MLATYVALRTRDRRNRRLARRTTMLADVSLAMGGALLLFLGAAEWRLRGVGFLLPAVAPHRDVLVLATCVAGAGFAHLSLMLAREFTLEPFRRFSSPRRWAIRSVFFPLLTSPTCWLLAILAVIALGWRGVTVVLLLYFANHASVRRAGARALILAIGLASTLNVVTAGTAATLCALVVAGTVLDLAVRLPIARRAVRAGADTAASWLRKEISCLRYYQSDRVYMGIAATSVLLVGSIILPTLGSDPGDRTLIWIIPWLGVLPFLRIVNNLLGTEAPAHRAMLAQPADFVAYMRWRLRFYSVGCYAIQAGLGIWVARAFGVGVLPFYGGICVALTESVLLVGLATSILFAERKPVHYSYAQGLASKNVLLSLIPPAAFLAVVLRMSGVVSGWRFFAVIVGLVLLETLAIPALGMTLLRHRTERLRRAF